MKRKTSFRISLALIIIATLITIYFYSSFPEQIDSHWDLQGRVNDTLPKSLGLFMVPVMALVIIILFYFLPRFDPMQESRERLDHIYGGVILVFTLFMLYVQSMLIIWNLGYMLNISLAIIPGISILFYYLGMIMKGIPRNWFIGIRTPWTLSDKKVWDRTHRLASPIFKAMAILLLLGLIFRNYMITIVFIPIIAAIFFLLVYSYYIYAKKAKKKEKHHAHRPKSRH